MADELNPYLMQIYRRAFLRQDPALVQVSFNVAVLDRYRDDASYSLIRSDTAGRIKREGGWAIDVGIGDEGTIHACLEDLMHVLPEADREHWAQHVATPPISTPFLQMRLSPGSCFDDGEIHDWE